jgi:arylsulfatase A-like enzyme
MDEVPNVIVVVLDDVGVDQIGAYGWPGAPATPTIDGLAERGLRFRHAWSMPVCSPSRAALLSGQMPHRNHVGAVIHTNQAAELPLSVITIPELLAEAPQLWSSAAVGKWHLSSLSSPSGAEHPWLQGFQHFSGSLNNIVGARTMVDWERVDFTRRTVSEVRFSSDAIVDDAVSLLPELREPFFLYVAFHAAHEPLMVPPGVELPDPTDLNALYAANVTYADQQLGRLLDGLGPRLARTLVVVVGDNGTPEHGKDADGMDGAKGSFLEGGINVPFVVAGPPVTARGVSDARVHLVDLFPTMMDLASVPRVRQELDGRSLVGAFRDADAPVHDVIYTELRHPSSGPPWRRVERCASDGEYKLVDELGEGERFYHLTAEGEAPVAESTIPSSALRALRKELARHPLGVTRTGESEERSRSDR